MTDIIEQILALYRTNGIECQTDNRLKSWGSDQAYYGIYVPWKGSRPTRMYCFFSIKTNVLRVIIPRRLRPEHVKMEYGLDCWGDPDDFEMETPSNHYGISIPTQNGLLNGLFTVAEKEDFFVQMANMRTGKRRWESNG